MALTKVLITVKTYPTISGKYEELVCTAGFTEEGDFIRIYPVPFRKLDFDKRYKKYQWVEVDLVKNARDFRPESFRPYSDKSAFQIIQSLDTSDYWRERKKVVLKKKVYTSLSELIADAKDKSKYTSLAVFKPTRILDFYVEQTERDWDKAKLEQIIAERKQMNLFDENLKEDFELVKKLPYKFKFKFVDENGIESNMMIEDWETGQLYWNSYRSHKDEAKAIADVRKKYFDDFAKTKDLYFYLGTTQSHHLRSRNPFMIIGTFHPKIKEQLALF